MKEKEKIIIQGITDLMKISLLRSLKENPEDFINDYQNIIGENAIIKYKLNEIKEYLTSYESIDTIQECENSENNKDLDRKTFDELVRRYMKVHDKVLDIIGDEKDEKTN